MKFIVAGCGLAGAVTAHEITGAGGGTAQVKIFDRRNHIAGNLYDYYDDHGILIHKYGPHTFHTKKKALMDYMQQFGKWNPYKLCCGAEIEGTVTCTPFNYSAVDLYFADRAKEIKEAAEKEFKGRSTIYVTEALNSQNRLVREYAEFLYNKDYRLYSAKQWGMEPSRIDPVVLQRVPLRLSYEEGYFDDDYQMMPDASYCQIIKSMLSSGCIEVVLNTDIRDVLEISDGHIYEKGNRSEDCIVIYTGALDELFDYRYGRLPYRSLRFELKYEEIDSFQKYPVVAYPQDKDIVRITEFKKIPFQDKEGTVYAMEYSMACREGMEPFYPVENSTSRGIWMQYKKLADQIDNLYFCGRLADFRYYNMDQAVESAIKTAEKIIADVM